MCKQYQFISSLFTEARIKIQLKLSQKLKLVKIVFCDITPCSPMKIKGHFGAVYLFHLQGRRISQAKKPA
jgi:hypothetical protein